MKQNLILTGYNYARLRRLAAQFAEIFDMRFFDIYDYFIFDNSPNSIADLYHKNGWDYVDEQVKDIVEMQTSFDNVVSVLKEAGATPTTLIDFFGDDFLLVIDESHVTVPQVRAMYNGDQMRKQSLVDYGFRLPSALDNRPLKFHKKKKKINQVIFVSATPGDYELEKTNGEKIEQIIRPTGLLDPIIEVRESKNQIDNLVEEINKQIEKNERTLITTLTIRMAEELTT